MNDIEKAEEAKRIESAVLSNPWRNSYWFARMLINNDKYGAVGKENKLMLEICICLRKILEDRTNTDDITISLSKAIIKQLFDIRFEKPTAKSARINLFYNDLTDKLETRNDIAVFILTVENIIVPINKAMEDIPSNDRQYTETIAKAYLDELEEKALATVINLWDDVGVEGCLNAERVAVVREFTNLKRDIEEFKLSEHETSLVLTAFVQEFERRLGQKRKSRAGGSLEDVATFLFNHFNIKAENKPDHFQADIEVDKWIRCSDKWLIGISCKRTLRERWKQVSSANAETLSKFKIKEIWHLVTYDEDLSDDKLTLLGGLRHVFYLRDDSRKLINAQQHIGMKNYVRPMSQFVKDIRREQGIK